MSLVLKMFLLTRPFVYNCWFIALSWLLSIAINVPEQCCNRSVSLPDAFFINRTWPFNICGIISSVPIPPTYVLYIIYSYVVYTYTHCPFADNKNTMRPTNILIVQLFSLQYNTVYATIDISFIHYLRYIIFNIMLMLLVYIFSN